MATPTIALIGTGAIALEAQEMLGPGVFVAAYCEPAYAATSRVTLPLCTSLEALRKVATHYVLALGATADRARLAQQLDAAGLCAAPPLVMPTAVVSPSAHLAPGCVVGHGVQIGSRCQIGVHNVLMHHTVMGHDSSTGAYVVIAPGVYVAGYVSIGDRVQIHANAAMAKGIRVGNDAEIGLAAACFRSVPEGARMVGNPARAVPR